MLYFYLVTSKNSRTYLLTCQVFSGWDSQVSSRRNILSLRIIRTASGASLRTSSVEQPQPVAFRRCIDAITSRQNKRRVTVNAFRPQDSFQAQHRRAGSRRTVTCDRRSTRWLVKRLDVVQLSFSKRLALYFRRSQKSGDSHEPLSVPAAVQLKRLRDRVQQDELRDGDPGLAVAWQSGYLVH